MTEKRTMDEGSPEKLDLRSLDVAEERRRELLRLFPEIETEGGKVDFERLKLALGEAVDAGKERFGLTWPGKADASAAAETIRASLVQQGLLDADGPRDERHARLPQAPHHRGGQGEVRPEALRDDRRPVRGGGDCG